MLSKNVDIVKGRVVSATDVSSFREEDHPRGQPGNAGQFGPGGGSSETSSKKMSSSERKIHASLARVHKQNAEERKQGIQRRLTNIVKPKTETGVAKQREAEENAKAVEKKGKENYRHNFGQPTVEKPQKKEPGTTTRIKKKEKLEKRKGRRAEKKGEVAQMIEEFKARGGQLSDRVKPIKLREMKKRLAALEGGGGGAPTHSPQVTGAATGGGPPSSLEKSIYSHPVLKPTSVFENGEVESWKISDKGGINKVYEAIIKGDGMGMTKSSVDEAKDMKDPKTSIHSVATSCKSRMKTDLWACSQTRREIMASDIDKLLGAGFIPPTVAKTIEGKGLCSCQTFVEGFQKGKSPGAGKLSKIYEAICFDEIIGSSDRHGGNHGLDAGGNIVFIDNGLTFNAFPREAWNGDYKKFVDFPENHQGTEGRARNKQNYTKDKAYLKACKKFTDNAYEHKDVIDKIFKHHGLPELEQEQFWGRIERRKALGERIHE